MFLKKRKVETTSNLEKAKKYLCLIAGFGLGLVLIHIYSNINMVIKQIHLLNDGKTIRVSYIFNSDKINIKYFTKIHPKFSPYLNPGEYEEIANEGFPILIADRFKILTHDTLIYNKAILREIGRNKYFEVI